MKKSATAAQIRILQFQSNEVPWLLVLISETHRLTGVHRKQDGHSATNVDCMLDLRICDITH